MMVSRQKVRSKSLFTLLVLNLVPWLDPNLSPRVIVSSSSTSGSFSLCVLLPQINTSYGKVSVLLRTLTKSRLCRKRSINVTVCLEVVFPSLFFLSTDQVVTECTANHLKSFVCTTYSRTYLFTSVSSLDYFRLIILSKTFGHSPVPSWVLSRTQVPHQSVKDVHTRPLPTGTHFSDGSLQYVRPPVM